MKLELASLKDNPTRDQKVDPIDSERVRDLARSIRHHKFWGGVVVGKVNGDHYVLAGHSRVRAAKSTGETHADLTVLHEPTQETMLRVYSMENATQRGNDSSSVAGTIAGAVRLIAIEKARDPTARSANARDQGIGEPAISKFLGVGTPDCIPGIGRNVIKMQLKNLKASGDYARIIKSVEREIEAEAKAAEEEAERKKDEATKAKAAKKREAAKRAKEASDKAGDGTIVFKLADVQKHLKSNEHVDVFRKLVTSKGVAEALKVEHQADLAASIVAAAAEQGRELTSNFIHEVVTDLLSQARYGLAADVRAQLKDESEDYHLARHQEYFADHVRSALKDLEAIVALARKREDVKWTPAFIKAVNIVHTMSDDLFTNRSSKPEIRRIGHATQKD